jgi:hypothetical protein
VGPRAGTITVSQVKNEYAVEGKISKGTSRWKLEGGKKPLEFTHTESWDSANEPIDSFPGDEAASPDRANDNRIVFSREEGTMQRPKPDTKCKFEGGFPILTSEHCSDMQALAAAQAITVCKGE